MKPIKIKLAGYLYILLTIFIGFASINTGNNLLYLITSFLLGIMGMSGFFGKINISNYDVELIVIEEIFANKNFSLKVILKNKKRYFPGFLIFLKTDKFTIFFPYIKKNSSISKVINLKFNTRGEHQIKEFTIYSQFPFGFFERYNYLNKKFLLIVYPEPRYYPINVLFDNNDYKWLKESAKLINKDYKGDLLSLREYSPGDNYKKIHWKATAKTDKIIVKEFSTENENINILEFEKINIPNIEQKISAITYLVLNKKIVLKIKEKILKHRKEILYELALF